MSAPARPTPAHHLGADRPVLRATTIADLVDRRSPADAAAVVVIAFGVAELGWLHEHGAMRGFVALGADSAFVYVGRAPLSSVAMHRVTTDVRVYLALSTAITLTPTAASWYAVERPSMRRWRPI